MSPHMPFPARKSRVSSSSVTKNVAADATMEKQKMIGTMCNMRVMIFIIISPEKRLPVSYEVSTGNAVTGFP
jgi:hypothetical protein